MVPRVQAEFQLGDVEDQDEVKGHGEGPLYRVFTHSGLLEKKDALVGVVMFVCVHV